MENKKQLSRGERVGPELSYFGLQAYWGITKHMGGLKATRELIELCHIGEGKYILEVGCGVGVTACYIAKKHGCRVFGVDISERMVERSNQRAKKDGVEDKVKFRVADAQNLPFEDGLFDAVICESVVAFPEDKKRVVGEYRRVTKPGGYVGLNEATWIKKPPQELVEYLSRTMEGAEFLGSEGWKELLESSGLKDTVARTYKTSALTQWLNEVRGLDVKDFLRAWRTFLSLYIKSLDCRRWVRGMWPPPKSVFRIFKYFGYGIYVGRK